MNPELETLYKQAEKAEKSHDFEAALECYQKILKKDPQEDHAYYSLANIYAIRGLVPQVIQQYLKLADVLEAKGQLEGAMEVCQWVISIEPAGTQARSKLIDLLEKQSRQKEAIHQSLILSRIYSALGHGEQSIELLQKRRELDPDNPELVLQLGEIYIKQGQIPEGIALYKTIAQELLKREDYGRALDVLRRIKSLRQDDVENIAALGDVYIRLGKLDEAKSEFRLILRQDLNHLGALSQLGLIAKMQGAWDEARLPFRKIVEQDPNNAFGRENYAEVNEVLGNQVEAIKHYLAAAEVYERSGQEEKAVEIYQNVLALDPDHSTARKRLEALGVAATPKKRSAQPTFLRQQRPLIRPSAESEQEAQPAFTESASQAASYAESVSQDRGGEEAEQEGEGEEETLTGQTSKWMLKPGLKSKGLTSEGRTPFTGKPKGPAPTPPPTTEGGIPRTRPAAKPVLTRSKDQGIPPKPQQPEKPKSLIEEIDFSQPGEDEVQAVYVAQPPPRSEEVHAAEAEPAPMAEDSGEASSVEPAPMETQPVEAGTSSEEEPPVQTFVLEMAAEEVQQPSAAEPEAETPLALEVTEIAPARNQEQHVEEKSYPSIREIELPSRAEPPAVRPSQEREPVSASSSNLKNDLEQLVSQGKVDLAIRLCRNAINENPGDRAVRLMLGNIYLNHGLLEEALEAFKGVAWEVEDAPVLASLAELHLLTGRWEEWAETTLSCAGLLQMGGDYPGALEAIGRVLAWNPHYVKARQLLISILKQQNMRSLAVYHHRHSIESLESSNSVAELIPAYQDLLEMKPDAFPVRYKLALCYQELGRIPEAKQEFVFLSTLHGSQGEREKEAEYLERALSLDPGDEGIMHRLRDVTRALGRKDRSLSLELKLGDAAFSREDFDSALASYQKVIEADPESSECMSRLVNLYIRKGMPEQALLMGKKLGDIYTRQGDAGKAVSLYLSLIKLDQEDASLHRGLAMLYSRGNQTKEAIQEFMTLGHLAVNKAQFDDAIDAYRQVLSLDGANKDARYQMGVILADHKNNWEAALAEFKKVKGIDPHHAATLSRLAKGYAAQGNYETALQYVHDLIRLDPANRALLEEFAKELETKLQKDSDNATLLFNYGILSRELGNLDTAIKEFQVVMRKSPQLALRAYAYQGMCWEEKALQEKEESLYQTALKVYRKGLELKGYKDEEYLELKYSLAKLYETLGKLQEAVSLYQEIVSVDMEFRDARDRKKQLEEEISSGKVTRLPSSRRQESAP